MMKIFQKVGFMFLIMSLFASGSFIFFEDQVSGFVDILSSKSIQLKDAQNNLSIAYSFQPNSLNPLILDNVTRSRLVDIYEGLVKIDRNLKLQPSLAISWGMLSKNKWEFIVREGVKFHNGNALNLKDILYSLKIAREDKNSQLLNLLSSIDSVTAESSNKILIQTKYPDPLLAIKLAQVYIIPENFKDFENPVGTGPYKLLSKEKGEQKMEKFEAYWGFLPYFSKVSLLTIPSKVERIDALKNNTIDLLVSVPPEQVQDLEDAAFQVKFIPSLEVGFLMFNLENSLFKNVDIRKAISLSIDRKQFLELSHGFAHVVNQFVSSGVFGYNPDLAFSQFDLVQAKKILDKIGQFEVIKVNFDYPESLPLLGEYMKAQLGEVGIQVKPNPMKDLDLQNKIAKGESDFYYLGWRSELGDAFDFLQSVVHSKDIKKNLGGFNGMNYSNNKVDQLIEKSQENLVTKDRLKDLQAVMKILVDDDYVGVPLFETDLIYAFEKKLNFEPRIDGAVYAAEISHF